LTIKSTSHTNDPFLQVFALTNSFLLCGPADATFFALACVGNQTTRKRPDYLVNARQYSVVKDLDCLSNR